MAAGKPRVLVVDDEPHERQGLSELIAAWGYAVEGAADGAQALEKLAAAPAHVVITDIRMPRMDGLQLLARIRQTLGDLPVLVLTGQGSKEAVVECLRLRANDYIEKPIRGGELKQRLADLVSEALRAAAPAEAGGGREREDADAEEWEFAGESKAVQEIRALIQQVAPTTASVLITGESGTGKEVVARRIHQLSPRRERTFLAVNCSAIPESLMESELFGHEKGAFTGAVERRAGCFELAQNGTVLLDEIGDMPVNTQAKLLRVLEDGRVRRLGGKSEVQLDVRVIAATNAPLDNAIREGRFREDLYYRLNVFPIPLPPLRDRKDDLPVLTQALLQDLNRKHATKVTDVSSEVLDRFRAYNWPGNVRELRNVLERAVILAGEGTILPSYLPPGFGGAPIPAPALAPEGGELRVPVGYTIEQAERALIELTLEHTKHNKTRAAEILGISQKTLFNKLKEYGAQGATVG